MTLALPAMVIGPESNGRSYGLLGASETPPPGSWLGDLPMMLLGWGKLQRPEGFAFCFPLDDGGALVGRGRFLRDLSLGPEAYVNMVRCTPAQLAGLDHRTDRVAAAIPPPQEGAGFARQAMILPAASGDEADAGNDWDGLNLAWVDRFITVAPGVPLDRALARAMASVRPPAQRARIRGWVTTAELPPRGSMDPLRDCQLVISREARPAHAHWLHPAEVRPDGSLAAEPVAPPPAWQTWQDVAALLAADAETQAALAALAWQPGLEREPPARLAAHMAREATAHLRAQPMLHLLQRMAAHPDAALREAGWQVLDDYLAALAKSGRAGPAALDWLRAAPADGHEAQLLRHVDGPALERVEPRDLAGIARLAARHAAGLAALPGGREALAAILSETVRWYRRKALPINPLLEMIAGWPDDSLRRSVAVRGSWLIDGLAREPGETAETITRKTIGPLREAFAASPGRAADARGIVGMALAAWKQGHDRRTGAGND